MRRLLSLLLLLGLVRIPMARAGEAVSEIPFTFQDGFILVNAQVAGQPLTFLLDSGAGASVLGLRAARHLHLRLGEREGVRGVESEAEAFHLRPLAVTVGERTIGHLGLALDLRRADDLCGAHVDGLIGIDFFAGHMVQIDYANCCLRFLPEAPAAVQSLPLRRLNGVLCTAISVNGSQPRWTRVDTGCNDALHWVVPRSEPRRKHGVSIGFITEEQNLTNAAVRLGDLALPSVETSLHGHPLFPGEAGLLGNGLLSRWTVTIDAVHQQLLLSN